VGASFSIYKTCLLEMFVCVRASAHLSKTAAFKCTSVRVSDLLLARHRPSKWDQQMGFIGV